MSSHSSADPLALLHALTASKQPDVANFSAALWGYVESGDPMWVSRVGKPTYDRKISELGRAVATRREWNVQERRIAEFAARLFRASPSFVWPNHHALLESMARAALSDDDGKGLADETNLIELLLASGFTATDLVQLTGRILYGGAFRAWEADSSAPAEKRPWERKILALEENELVAALTAGDASAGFVHALRHERPEVVQAWIRETRRTGSYGKVPDEHVVAVLETGDDADDFAVEFVDKATRGWDRASVLEKLIELRPERHQEVFLSFSSRPEIFANSRLFERLFGQAPDRALALLPAIYSGGHFREHYAQVGEYRKALELAARDWKAAGAVICEAIVSHADPESRTAALELFLRCRTEEGTEGIAALARRLLGSLDDLEAKARIYRAMAMGAPTLFADEWRDLLGGSSKQLREIAADAWAVAEPEAARLFALDKLRAKRADQRLGAAAVLLICGTGEDAMLVRRVMDDEKSPPVRAEFGKVLAKAGVALPAKTERDGSTEIPATLAEWEGMLAAQKRKTKAPAAEWLDVPALPALFGKDGSTVGLATIAHVFAIQAARKEIANGTSFDFVPIDQEAGNSGEQLMRVVQTPVVGQRSIQIAPDLAPVFALIDRARSGDFALALLNAWLGSEQEAKHRWAMAIAGALGDTRILSVLNSWIPKWCEASRGKLAEYAARAIALQGGDEALMLLDALATRYRSKQRNIGAAAAQAFQSAADARGLSADELGDVVVPAFGFNEDGLRDFAWEGGAARAELGVDLKLGWSDPESDKALKGLPASAPDARKAEAKELGKLLREAAKSQTARLELSLVRQRRWPAARWRELYETHPVLRAFATRLVWGVYGADGALLRCFRRYPNGLLADAAGGLEELPEADARIGMVHPLELSTEATTAWRAHLARFKVTPPFPQLDRAVERLDPLHANRRELALVQGKELGAGTFRSRAEKRGWQRGSVVDGGGVSGYFKAFPGAGVEVSIDLDGLFIGIDPMDTVTLGVARFSKADSVERGSYVYDDPKAGDERLLAFGAVPAVVYSETVGDLKAIAGIVADADTDADGGEP